MTREEQETATRMPTVQHAPGFPAPVVRVTKFDLIQEAAKKSGISQGDCMKVFEEMCSEIKDLMRVYNVLILKGIGTFYTKERKGRPARNPRTNEVHDLPARRVVLVRFSPDIKDNMEGV